MNGVPYIICVFFIYQEDQAKLFQSNPGGNVGLDSLMGGQGSGLGLQSKCGD